MTHQEAMEFILTECKNRSIEADCILNSAKSLQLKSEKSELSEYKVTSQATAGVRVIKDNKVGISYSESLKREDLINLINNAQKNAEYSAVNEHEKIQTSDKLSLDGTCERTFKEDNTDVKDKIELCLSLERDVVRKEYATNAPYCAYGDSISHHLYGNTSGISCTQKNSQFYCYTSALLQKDNLQSMQMEQSSGLSFDEISAKYCIDGAYNKAFALLDGKAMSTGKYDVIFTIDCLASLFGAFSSVFSARGAMDGVNPWKDKLSQSVGSSMLTIKDEPRYEGGLNYTLFDSEGLTCEPVTLIENGELTSFYHNSVTASFFGTKNNCHGARGTKSSLSVSGTHKIVSTGETSNDQLTKDKYIEVVDMQGLHSGVNAISGDFSFAFQGFFHENGEKTPVKEMTISGNFFELIKQIESLGDTLEASKGKTFFAPKIRFSGMTCAG